MPICRRKLAFTIIPNGLLARQDLSWKAKGLLCYLFSYQREMAPMLVELEGAAIDGRYSLRSGLKELQDKGLLVIDGHYWHIFEQTPGGEAIL